MSRIVSPNPSGLGRKEVWFPRWPRLGTTIRQTNTCLQDKQPADQSKELSGPPSEPAALRYLPHQWCLRKYNISSQKSTIWRTTNPATMGSHRNRDFQICGARNRAYRLVISTSS